MNVRVILLLCFSCSLVSYAMERDGQGKIVRAEDFSSELFSDSSSIEFSNSSDGHLVFSKAGEDVGRTTVPVLKQEAPKPGQAKRMVERPALAEEGRRLASEVDTPARYPRLCRMSCCSKKCCQNVLGNCALGIIGAGFVVMFGYIAFAKRLGIE